MVHSASPWMPGVQWTGMRRTQVEPELDVEDAALVELLAAVLVVLLAAVLVVLLAAVLVVLLAAVLVVLPLDDDEDPGAPPPAVLVSVPLDVVFVPPAVAVVEVPPPRPLPVLPALSFPAPISPPAPASSVPCAQLPAESTPTTSTNSANLPMVFGASQGSGGEGTLLVESPTRGRGLARALGGRVSRPGGRSDVSGT